MHQMQEKGLKVFLLIALLSALSACPPKQVVFDVRHGQENEKIVPMEASSYRFSPDVINAFQGDRLKVVITNTSRREHNFTIMDPHGDILQNVNLPAGRTVPVEVALNRAGDYYFYCGKPFHAIFGMTGWVHAAPL